MQSQYPNNLLEMLIELMDSKQHPWFDDAKVGLSRGKPGICIIASKARLATAPPEAIACVSTRGVICQLIPHLSWHQPH